MLTSLRSLLRGVDEGNESCGFVTKIPQFMNDGRIEMVALARCEGVSFFSNFHLHVPLHYGDELLAFVAVMNTHVSFPRIYGYEECL